MEMANLAASDGEYVPEIPETDFGCPTVLFSKTPEEEPYTLPDALVACVNLLGRVDMDEISRLSGCVPEEVASVLGGHAIFQDPAAFLNADSWNARKGWMLREQYLSGNIPSKLALAERMNAHFPGCFSDEIEALRACLPCTVPFSEIYVSLGAPWIPPLVCSAFIRDLLKMKKPPAVWYIPALGLWRVEVDKSENGAYRRSVLNNITYGTSRMSAVQIIRETLNARSAKVYDEISRYRGTGKSERVLNHTETMRAQEKQRLINEAFVRWIASDPAVRAVIEDAYNKQFTGYSFPAWDGSFLALSDMNPAVSLFPHQRNAVARILLSDRSVLLSHEVGTGKTYIMAAAAHELYRTGLSRKNLTVVPNNILRAAEEAHRLLFPGDRILAVYPKDFTPARREGTLEAIRDGDFAAVYMACSSFDMIRMSKDYRRRKKADEIRSLRTAAANTPRSDDRNSLNAKADNLAEKLAEFERDFTEPAWLPFDALGVETLFVDEAHNYKNIPLTVRADHVVGMQAKGSRKCGEMLEKVRSVKKAVFATGTPLTNSIADLFVMQCYLQPEILAFHGIDTFDTWAGTFAEWETVMEIDVDSQSIRPMQRITAFNNLPELMAMFSGICDYHENKVRDGLPDYDGPENIVCRRTPAQAAYIRAIADRVSAVRSKAVNRKEDNLLRITSDGRKCALDMRLVTLTPDEKQKIRFSPADFADCKIAVCAEKVREVYEAHPGTLQIVFSDLGTPKEGFNVYDCLRGELMRRGIPAGEIAFIHDADGEQERERLFGRMNRGEVRVVIGSTAKLGMGVNIQEKLAAIHHLSIPWKPSELVQREGRILRRGNTCPKIHVFRYVTDGTFDAYLYQLIENKARFIASFLSGVSAVRGQSDIADTVLSYAEIKALAVGNPLLRKRVETANRLERVRLNIRQRQNELAQLNKLIALTPARLEQLRTEAKRIRKDAVFCLARRRKHSASEREAFGQLTVAALDDGAMREEERFVGVWQGFAVRLPAGMKAGKPYLWVCGPEGTRYHLDMADVNARGVTMRIDHLLDHLSQRADLLDGQIREVLQHKAEAERDLEGGNPFLASAERLEKELAEIDRKLAV